MGCHGQFWMFFVCVRCTWARWSHTHACFICISLAGEKYAACKGLVCAGTCLVLHSVMMHPHSPKKSNSRNTGRPNTSQDFYFGWGFPPWQESALNFHVCVIIRGSAYMFSRDSVHTTHNSYFLTCIVCTCIMHIHALTFTHTHTVVSEFQSLMPRIDNTKLSQHAGDPRSWERRHSGNNP